MPKADRRELRRDEKTGLPIFIIINQIKKFCHNHIQEQTEDGNVFDLKIHPTQKFMDKLNEVVVDLIEESIGNAREDERIELTPADIPSLNGDEEEED